jgi:hypothetical protein
MYMRDLSLKYGFLSTYEQTIFVRQELVNGQWELQYSPSIRHSTSATSVALPANFTRSVSLRQSFWHLATLAQAGHVATNPLPSAQWVVSATPK